MQPAFHRLDAEVLRYRRSDWILCGGALRQWPNSGIGAPGDRRRYRAGQTDRGNQTGLSRRDAAWTRQIRRLRQSHFHGLYPKGRKKERQARQHHHQELSGCQSVLALRSEGISQAACVLARFPATKKLTATYEGDRCSEMTSPAHSTVHLILVFTGRFSSR